MKDEKSSSRIQLRRARLLSGDRDPIERQVHVIGVHLPSEMGVTSVREDGRMDWYRLVGFDEDGTLLFEFVETRDKDEWECSSPA